MLCRYCGIPMISGTRYEKEKGKDKPSHKRYFGCNKCGDRIYTKASNFQEIMKRESEKCRKGNK